MYNYIISFLTRDLRKKQVEKDFNSQGELEVSIASLSEIVTNGILHRSYVIEAPLWVFIFDNRIEIHSPGLLPEGVSMESIKHGASVPRNKLLFNHGINLLPYTGAGSGIPDLFDICNTELGTQPDYDVTYAPARTTLTIDISKMTHTERTIKADEKVIMDDNDKADDKRTISGR